jgi:transcriptional regulator with PAS, ATPase and Fis domain
MILLSQQLERELKVRSVGNDDDDFVAESDVMRRLVERAQTVAELPINVLILGENGTGKERIARMLHDGSERREGPFVAVNCAAIPESLAESEFFGYEKGAFTGATQGRGGRFEDARGGTLFLDEIGDLPPTLQPKFLRVLQEGRGQRLGSSDLRSYDFRVVSATNRDLKAEVASGRFREDLYYRLFSVELTLPPLRERGPDRVRLAMAFLRSTCRRFGKRIEPFTPAVIDLFERYPWPGNVRQLRNEVERLVAFTPDGRAPGVEACSPELLQAVQRSPEPLHAGAEGDPTLPGRVGALERELIREALAVTGGNREKAARRLGISRQGLYKKMERHGLS